MKENNEKIPSIEFQLVKRQFLDGINKGCATVRCKKRDQVFVCKFFFNLLASNEWEFYYMKDNIPEEQKQMENWFINEA